MARWRRSSPPVPDERETLRTRQRFARRQWARRWLALRYVLLALTVVGLVATGIWLVWFSSVLAVSAVDVNGTRLLSHAEVRRAAGIPEGTPLARVDLAAVHARVEALVEVESAEVTRAWPDQVRIDVDERVSVAVVDLGRGDLRGMDEHGVVFQRFRSPPAGLPRVRTSGETRPEALREAAAVVSALPDDLARRVAHVDVETVDQIALVLRDGRRVVWGSAEQSDLKAQVLQALLEQRARVYDVSVPGSPVTRATP